MSQGPIAIALVSIGKIARDQHVPAICGSGEFVLAAAVSRNASLDGVETYGALGEMLAARADVAAVSLCMPPAARFEHAAEAIAAGRHTMLEKPPGATVAECFELQRLAAAAGVSLFATWHSREAAQVDAARDWLAGKRLRRLQIVWKEDVRRWHPGQDWVWEPGGMGVFDPGINALSIMTRILPDPVHIAEAQLDVPENRQTPIAARVRFRHPGGAEIAAEFDWRQTGEQVWEIHAECDEGTLALTRGGAELTVNGAAVSVAGDREYPRLYARFAELIRAGQSDCDFAPLIHVADALALGRRRTVAPFEF